MYGRADYALRRAYDVPSCWAARPRRLARGASDGLGPRRAVFAAAAADLVGGRGQG
jgi:hypothetical protein